MNEAGLAGKLQHNGRRSRHLTAVLALLVGILIGAGSTEVVHAIRRRHQGPSFESRVRCRDLAEAYSKRESNELTTIFLHRSDFSRARESCVAAISSVDGPFWNYEVVDVLTGEALFSDQCSEKGTKSDRMWCGNGRNVELRQEADRAFDKVVK